MSRRQSRRSQQDQTDQLDELLAFGSGRTEGEVTSVSPEFLFVDEPTNLPAGWDGGPQAPVNESLEMALKRRGISSDYIVRKLQVLLSATRPWQNSFTGTVHWLPDVVAIEKGVKLYAILTRQYKAEATSKHFHLHADLDRMVHEGMSTDPEIARRRIIDVVVKHLQGEVFTET